jgi:hypothetical protein
MKVSLTEIQLAISAPLIGRHCQAPIFQIG